jgi:RNA polymerase sigma-70 factor, ECF subfamily
MGEPFHETADLLRAAQRGDETSRGELLVRHEGKIRALVRARTGNKLRSVEETADLVQDVLLGLIRDLDPEKLATEDDFDRFIAGVVRNKVASRARIRREDSNGKGGENQSAPFARKETGPFDRAARNEHREKLRRALERLPEAQQLVVQLRDFEERRFVDIAAALGKSEEAVQMLHHRAWVRLTILLAESEGRDPSR